MTDPSKDVLSKWDAESRASLELYKCAKPSDNEAMREEVGMHLERHERILALIELIRKKDEALRDIVLYLNRSDGVSNYIGTESIGHKNLRSALALTESLGK